MIGKLIGRVVGETIALPFTVLGEGAQAIDKAGDVLSKRVDEAFDPKPPKSK